MKKALSLFLVLVMLVGMMPMTAFAAEDDVDAVTDEVTNASETLDIDLFVFAGQSNMMGASVLEPKVDTFTDKSFEYKYLPKLRGEATGSFVSAQNPAGEFYYNDLTTAYGDMLNDLSYKSTLSNYSANTYFCPAMRDGVKSFSAQSEADTYPAASLAPYFVTEYAEYGHASVYAHMAKGSAKIVHYFTPEMVTRYNTLITEYNNENGKSYSTLSVDSLSGAGDAFDKKYNAMVEDYATFAPDKTVKNKCFVWLQGESDGSNYIEYKLKLQVLWEHLQELGFTHFFVLRVGYWGNTGILNVIKAQEDFCAENDNCYIITRAPSLIPHATATTDNWWIDEPSAEYDNCRDSYLVNSSNNHFNEKAMQIFAERSAANVHRILHQGLEPVLEAENIQGMVAATPEADMPEDTTPYTSYVGTEVFHNGLSVSNKSNVWKECTSSTAASTDLIPVNSADSVWLQYVFFLSEAHAVGGFYDIEGNLVAPLYYKNFGFSLGGGGGTAAFRTPEATNRISIADIESATGKKIAFVRFTAWQASAGGHANTEARIYHEEVNSCPIITQQPVDGEAKLGERYCVTVEAEGEGLTYQWYFRNAGSDKWYKSGVTDNTYDDVMTTARAGREVYCVITDANGKSVTTETATLVHKIVELEIVTQPTNSEAILGENFCVTVEAQGEGLKYQWYFCNAGSEAWCKSGVRDNTYDDVMTKARAGREVYCIVTDAYGNSVTTDVATLIRIPINLEITSQPTDATAAFGETFCATVEAKGEGLKYQWYFRNAGSNTWHKSGVRDNTYDDVMTKARNGREIYCVITDIWGNSITTDTVKLIAVPKVELKIVSQTYQSAAMGERFCVTVNAQGDGLTYTWYFRNAGSDKWYKSSVRDNTYDDVMTKARANREVYCVITDAYGNQVTTEVVTIAVAPQ